MALPLLRTRVPGPRSRRLARELPAVESRNVTHISADWPIFWARARGSNVWDVDGNRYLDLTAAFGVANVGHNHPRVTAAIARQAARLTHAMGDVHPNELKLRLARALVALTFGRWERGPARVVFGSSGAEAVEIALKTAAIHTGKPGLLAFAGGYHGLTYGALAATSRPMFREPFAAQLGNFVTHLPYGLVPSVGRDRRARRDNRARLGRRPPPLPISQCGAVLVEPIQGRGGIVVPPAGFLSGLRRFCDQHGLVLILDEIYTGLGRTGRWFACEHDGVVPDLVCVGKSLGGGLPLSACIGRASVMDSWPVSAGEAIHTSTFLGNPVACAAGLAVLAELNRQRLPERAARLEQRVRARFPGVRGRGLLLGLPVANAPALCEQLLKRGIIALPEGDQAEVLSITPPLSISDRDLAWALEALECGGSTPPCQREA